jgi:hypothetical protein
LHTLGGAIFDGSIDDLISRHASLDRLGLGLLGICSVEPVHRLVAVRPAGKHLEGCHGRAPLDQVAFSNRKACGTTTSEPVRNHSRAAPWPVGPAVQPVRPGSGVTNAEV